MSGIVATSPTLSATAKAARDAESNLPFILGITVTFHVLALTAVLLRTYVRTFVVKVMGWDDYTMIGAMVRFKFSLLIFHLRSKRLCRSTVSKKDLMRLEIAFVTMLINPTRCAQ
jgi:hypothetical protein